MEYHSYSTRNSERIKLLLLQKAIWILLPIKLPNDGIKCLSYDYYCNRIIYKEDKMENITQTPYAPKTWSNFAITQANPTRKQKAKKLSQEDIEIVAALEAVISDMDFLHNCFDQTTEAILVDSLIYELKALNLRYQYYLNLCKEKGIIHAGIPESRK